MYLSWIDEKYVGMISYRLQFFKKRGNGYNFRCIICGDSKKSKTKCRAWIYKDKNCYNYYCYNCSYSSKFSTFLKKIDSMLYIEYKKEILQETNQEIDNKWFFEPEEKVERDFSPVEKLKKISQLKSEDSIKKFVTKRKIPTKEHSKLYSCPNFMNFTNVIIPHKFAQDSLLYDERRLLIPFYNREGILFGYQGRSLNSSSKTKYITIIGDDKSTKVFGLDRVDFSKQIFVFEGPIDSMFIKNSIATAGGDIASCLKDFPTKENFIVVYDNEPRARETIKKISKAIDNGYPVVIWPSYIKQKDINDMILAGYTEEVLVDIMNSNVYNGAQAKVRLMEWKKVDVY